MDDLMEYIAPFGNFEPEQWVFEQISLRMPLLNICSLECPGPDHRYPEGLNDLVNQKSIKMGSFDPLWT